MKQMVLIPAIFFATIMISFGQPLTDEPCKLMLQNGLYKTFNIVRSGNFEQDIKTYFSSETFRNDYRNKKWSGKIIAIINGAPIELGSNSGDLTVNAFQQQVINSTSFSLKQSFYDYSLSLVPDVDLAKEYTNCLIQTRKFGFKLFADVTDKDVIFIINYTKENNVDPMPTVTNFAIINGTVKSGGFTNNQQVLNNNTIICERDINKDLSLVLETDKGVVTYKVSSEPSGFNKDLPVGTIICSYLNFDQFSAVTDNNIKSPGNVYISKYSKWAPADGRAVPNSQFATITSQNIVPDLRGVFIRGLNQFDQNSPVPQDNSKNDPINRLVGTYQSDELKSHNHKFRSPVNGSTVSHPAQSQVHADFGDAQTEMTGGTETRPKNIAVYYYIRIN